MAASPWLTPRSVMQGDQRHSDCAVDDFRRQPTDALVESAQNRNRRLAARPVGDGSNTTAGRLRAQASFNASLFTTQAFASHHSSLHLACNTSVGFALVTTTTTSLDAISHAPHQRHEYPYPMRRALLPCPNQDACKYVQIQFFVNTIATHKLN